MRVICAPVERVSAVAHRCWRSDRSGAGSAPLRRYRSATIARPPPQHRRCGRAWSRTSAETLRRRSRSSGIMVSSGLPPNSSTGCAAPAFVPGAIAATSADSSRKNPAEPARAPAEPHTRSPEPASCRIAPTMARIESSRPPGVSSLDQQRLRAVGVGVVDRPRQLVRAHRLNRVSRAPACRQSAARRRLLRERRNSQSRSSANPLKPVAHHL